MKNLSFIILYSLAFYYYNFHVDYVIIETDKTNKNIFIEKNKIDNKLTNEFYSFVEINNIINYENNIINSENKIVTIKCLGKPIGSEFFVNGTSYLVVDNNSIKNNIHRASTICTSYVTDMNSLFYDKPEFNQDISYWDTSNVTSMARMFQSASSFNQPLNRWNTSNVINMFAMFNNAISFNQDISNWNTAKVNDMNYMFKNAINFNQDISSWNVSNVTEMNGMFEDTKYFNQDISSWDVSNVTKMNSIFKNSTYFNQNLNNWCVSKLKNYFYDFSFTSSLSKNNMPINGACFDRIVKKEKESTNNTIICNKGIPGSIFEENGEKYIVVNNEILKHIIMSKKNEFSLNNLCTSKIKSMKDLFANTSINEDISKWDTSNVTNMDNMFQNALFFNQPIGNWNTSNVTSTQYMFSGAKAFNQPIGNWDVSNVKFMSNMFAYTSNFNQDLSKWNTSNSISMSSLFYNSELFNQDISNWDVSNVIDVSSMFFGAKSFNQNLNKWCLNKITSKPYNFHSSLKQLPIFGNCFSKEN